MRARGGACHLFACAWPAPGIWSVAQLLRDARSAGAMRQLHTPAGRQFWALLLFKLGGSSVAALYRSPDAVIIDVMLVSAVLLRCVVL